MLCKLNLMSQIKFYSKKLKNKIKNNKNQNSKSNLKQIKK